MKTIIIMLLALSAEARIKPYTGPSKTDNPEYDEMYVSQGKTVSDGDAFMAAIRGDKVYKCVLQEAAMGKTGRSASLKNVPKKH